MICCWWTVAPDKFWLCHVYAIFWSHISISKKKKKCPHQKVTRNQKLYIHKFPSHLSSLILLFVASISSFSSRWQPPAPSSNTIFSTMLTGLRWLKCSFLYSQLWITVGYKRRGFHRGALCDAEEIKKEKLWDDSLFWGPWLVSIQAPCPADY